MESDHVPQHDPPPGSDLIQPEVDERDDSILVEGDDADHVLPPTELDPYTPEPSPPNTRARRAVWLAIAVVVLVVVAVVVAATR